MKKNVNLTIIEKCLNTFLKKFIKNPNFIVVGFYLFIYYILLEILLSLFTKTPKDWLENKYTMAALKKSNII